MKKYTDLRLIDTVWILRKIGEENDSQLSKWGIQTHTAFEWLTIATEELGELAQAILGHAGTDSTGGTKGRVVHEAIQVATITLKIAEMFEKSEDK